MNNFQDNSNKQLLWELMDSHKLFKNIDNQHFGEVQNLFEEEIKLIDENNRSLNLVSKNKMFLSSIINKLNKFKTPEIFTHTAAELQLKKQKELENNYNKKQNEFNELINSHLPQQSIDFSDKNDSPFDDDIDKIIKQTIAARDLEIENIMRAQPNSLNNNNNNNNSWGSNNFENSRNIVIGENLNNDVLQSNLTNINDTGKMPLILEKNVKFNLDNNSDINKNDSSNYDNNYHNELSELKNSVNKILNNQDKIIDLLTNITLNKNSTNSNDTISDNSNINMEYVD